MISKIIMEKWKTALYLAWHRLRGALYSFIQLWKTVLYSIGYRSLLSFKEDLKLIKFLGCDLMSWSFGIALAIILLLLVGT